MLAGGVSVSLWVMLRSPQLELDCRSAWVCSRSSVARVLRWGAALRVRRGCWGVDSWFRGDEGWRQGSRLVFGV